MLKKNTLRNYEFILDNFQFFPAAVRGDIDGNGTVDLSDALLSLKVISGNAEAFPIDKEADVDGDGKIGLEVALYALQKVSELR